MIFPFYLSIGHLKLHPHLVFETLAYFVSFRAYLMIRSRFGDVIALRHRVWVLAAAAGGALLGSKILFWFSDPALFLTHWNDSNYILGGKTIVGALTGGLLAVEWAKKKLNITKATGDLFAVPLCLGIAIGRIGCFLTGLSDHTYGNPTHSSWGVDLGDGILRHPVQLYEMAWLFLLATWLLYVRKHVFRNGDLFKTFMVGYMGFRFLIEFIKPGVLFFSLTAIQWVCLMILFYYGRDMPYLFFLKKEKIHV